MHYTVCCMQCLSEVRASLDQEGSLEQKGVTPLSRHGRELFSPERQGRFSHSPELLPSPLPASGETYLLPDKAFAAIAAMTNAPAAATPFGTPLNSVCWLNQLGADGTAVEPLFT